MTVSQARSVVKALQKDVRRELVWAADRALRGALGDAKALSSGPFTLAQLRKMGHPYARRAPGALDPAVINVQSGRFRQDWQADVPRMGDPGDVVRGRISNQSPVADYLQYGTRYMVARPVGLAVASALHNRAVQEVERAERRLALWHR